MTPDRPMLAAPATHPWQVITHSGGESGEQGATAIGGAAGNYTWEARRDVAEVGGIAGLLPALPAGIVAMLAAARAISSATDKGEAGVGSCPASESDPPAWEGTGEKPRALVVFAGDLQAAVHLCGELRSTGFDVTARDTRIGGEAHDVIVEGGVGESDTEDIRAGRYQVLWLATPCESYSVLLDPPLRFRDGRPPPAGWEDYVAKHDSLARLTARMITAADEAGTLWALENPADAGERGRDGYWEAHADRAFIWQQPAITAALQGAGAKRRTFAFCAFGARARKWTTVAYARAWDEEMRELGDRRCRHGFAKHAERLFGRDERGRNRSAGAAAYPAEFCRWAAGATKRGVERTRGETSPRGPAWSQEATEGRSIDDRWIEGGRVRFGAELHPTIRRELESRRAAPPRFASMRNLRAESAEALALEPFPHGLHIPAPEKRRKRKLKRRPPLPRRQQPGGDGEGGGDETPPTGKITIDMLYLPGVYEHRVQSWFRLADAACGALRRRAAGEDVAVPSVPTRVIEQWEQPRWARGKVYDCTKPENCVEVERSTRSTVFPGRRQLDRAELRRAADRCGWDAIDPKIVEQAGEGGVETRSECDLITVLTFHHPGLIEEAAAAAKVVQAHIDEGWVGAPTRHLPFVPCRLQPRDVILQDRHRVVEGETEADGRPKIEHYLKPRITTNSSHGGVDGVNGGVPATEREARLPRAQWLTRAAAICDTAAAPARGGRRQARARGYCVDDESAYSFIVVQAADHWMQCFLWWDDVGDAGVCRDWRMGFGGAYAVNRFERISTLVSADVERLQNAFDDDQPPELADGWVERRPPGERERRPSYRMVYIDDLTGTALDDEVREPSMVSHIVIDPVATEALGGTFAPRGTRVHVHAQLAVFGVRRMGLATSKGKVTVGDPIDGLGFTMEFGDGRLRCPKLKRAALLESVADASSRLERDARVECRSARRLVHRLANLAQIFPELTHWLPGGYRVASTGWERKQASGERLLQLAAGSPTAEAWGELLVVATEILEVNDGVPAAPCLTFADSYTTGSIVAVTDASGHDGCGGYAFAAHRPGEVWLVSEPWPPEVLAAREAAEIPKADRPVGGPHGLAMPAAELFASWAVAVTAARAAGMMPCQIGAVANVTDCAPAALALDAASSGSPQMLLLLQHARRLTKQWMGVPVPREANKDADRLSHPELLGRVVADARAAGLVTHVARVDEALWATLRDACRLPTRAGERAGRLGAQGKGDGR